MTSSLPLDAIRHGAQEVDEQAGRAAVERARARPAIAILGTRGIPAQHGGFETFAERLALYLAARDWDVTVYCQTAGSGRRHEAEWNGVRLVQIPEPRAGARGTMVFDWKSTIDAARRNTLMLTLGYNTAAFCAWYRLRGRTNLINMDGLEWQRAKWRLPAKTWLYLNERLGCWLGNHLIADHPEIAKHLETRVSERKITTIPYGADAVLDADESMLERYSLEPRSYALVVARPEPENSILEIVSAFSARPRGKQLVVLGKYEPERNPYHAAVLQAASAEVLFPGAIYDQAVVAALRFFAQLYVHGHTVGGTNPALVEALGAGCAVLAHDNRFNRWVAGSENAYFASQAQCETAFDALLEDDPRLAIMRSASRQRHAARFAWDTVLAAYEDLLLEYVPVAR